MDETEFKQTYSQLNPNRCCFEKAINSRNTNCSLSLRFNLADREGVACQSASARERCEKLLESVRVKSSFALRTGEQSAPMPHNAEIRIQLGTINALAGLLDNDLQQDVDKLFRQATIKFGALEAFPFEKIIRGVTRYQSRSRKRLKKT